MIGFRPYDFDFGQQMLNVTRSTIYVNAKYHPRFPRRRHSPGCPGTLVNVGPRQPSRTLFMHASKRRYARTRPKTVQIAPSVVVIEYREVDGCDADASIVR